MVNLSQENRNIMFETFRSELPQLMELQNRHPGPTLALNGYSAGTGYFEGWLAYVLLRCAKPKIVFELGGMYGFATYALALAVKNNGFGKVYTFEGIPHRAEALNKNMENAGLHDWVHVVSGMIEAESLPLLKQVGGKIDVLFCDDGHDDLAPKWYIPNLFPHVTQLVFVHDMTYGTPEPEGKDEKTIIFEFLRTHPEYQNFLVKDYYPQCPLPEKREVQVAQRIRESGLNWERAKMSDDGTDWKSFVYQWAIHHEKPDSRHLNFLLVQHGCVLEIGCGVGRWSRLFTEKNLLYVGVDLEPEALKIAKTKKLDLVRGDVRFLPFKDNSFEFVFSCDVLQHFRSTSTMPSILREAHRVLSAKGQLIINEALSQDWSQQLAPLFTLVFSNVEYPLGTSENSIGKSLMFAKENKL